jgi:succinate-acetate transporter protein
MIFYHIAAFGCKTFKFGESNSFYSAKLGYWSADTNGGCTKYDVDISNGSWRFGRFVGVFGALMIWAIFAVVMTASCFKYPRPKLVFRTISICMGVISLFSFLLLVGLSSDSALSLSGGGALAIISAFLWAGNAVSMLFCMNERERVPASSTKPEVGTKAPVDDVDKNVTENEDV